jgi:hypothetical protein
MPTRVTIPPAIADLGFSIDMPDGFIHADVPKENVDFDNPTQSAPLAVFSSQVALAIIAVAARPAYETGSVLQWMKYLCDFFGIEIASFTPAKTAGAHTHLAIFAEGSQEQNGQQLRIAIVAFEDGGRFVTAHAMCPFELWPSYGEQLIAALRSISLTSPKGPTHDLDSLTAEGWTKITPAQQRKASEKYMKELTERRAPAEQVAADLLAKGQYDEAELAIQRVDSSIYGAVAIARLYESRLKTVVAQGGVRTDKDQTETLFRRALSWAQHCYPEPHTGCEAEQYESGRAEDRMRLVAILGYDPQ